MLRLPFDPFGPIAPVYDRLHRSVAEEALRQLLAPRPGMVLLDLGGGTGRVARLFQTEVKRLVVLDPSRGMLARARRRPGLDPVRGMAEHLPLRDASVDRVLCVDALHHFRDHRAALAEVSRVLAPGGLLVVQEFNVATWTGRLLRLAEALLLLGSAFHRPWELMALVAETGLQPQVYNEDARAFFLVAAKS